MPRQETDVDVLYPPAANTAMSFDVTATVADEPAGWSLVKVLFR